MILRRLRQSLRARLLALLLAAVGLAAGVQATVAYRAALAEADEIFDYHMRQMALSLRAGLPPGAVRESAPLPPNLQGEYDFVVQVWRADGLPLYQSQVPNPMPERAVLGFSTVPTRNGPYRVFSIQTPSQVIQVAQDLAARTRMARGLAWRTVAPIALGMPLLMLAMWWLVGRALRPAQRVGAQLAQRQADDLAPVAEQGLPSELKPLVQEFNALLGRVQQAFDAQQAFVADAAHELRSPLAALRLQAQALQRADGPEARDRAAGRLIEGIDRAHRLVAQLLDLARQQAGPAGPEPRQPVRLDELAREVLADAAAQAEAAGVQLTLLQADTTTSLPGQAEARVLVSDQGAGLVYVSDQGAALAVALRNLVDNAIKYTPAGGQVTLAVRQAADGATLQVDDSGPGIPEAARTQALARFHRLPGSAGPGSGLGLAIVQAIAQRHGARLVLGQAQPLGGLRAALVFGPPNAPTAPTAPP